MLTTSFHTVHEAYSGQEVLPNRVVGGNPDDSCEWPVLHIIGLSGQQIWSVTFHIRVIRTTV